MTFGAFVYFFLLALWSAYASYLILFKVIPQITGKKPRTHAPHAKTAHHAPAKAHTPAPAPRRTFSAREGFRSFARGAELTVEDIVRGLSKLD